MKTLTPLFAGVFLMAMFGTAAAAEAAAAEQAAKPTAPATEMAKPEHMAKAMTTQECSTFMAKQAQPGARNDASAKQSEAYCARKLEKELAKEGKLPTASVTQTKG